MWLLVAALFFITWNFLPRDLNKRYFSFNMQRGVDPSAFAGRGNQNPGQHFAPQGDSPNQKGNAPRRTAPAALRICTVKSILEANRVGDGVLVVDGRELGHVCVAGRILEREVGTNASTGAAATTAKHYSYTISDGTGVISIRHWVDQAAGDNETLEIGSFLRASGTVKIWQNAPVITGHVRQIVDTNELTVHLLDALRTHLRITRGAKTTGQTPALNAPLTPNSVNVSAQPVGPQDKVSIFVAIERAIKQSGSPRGLNVDEVTTAISRFGFNTLDVRAALRQMVNEGKCYTTGDGRYSA